jgi:hypothetical protein
VTGWPAGETAAVLRPGSPTRDLYGNDVPGIDTETVYDGCAIWPRTSSEDVQARDQVIEGLYVLFPPGADVQATDLVRARGATYLVDGEPGLFRSPLTGTALGPQVSLTRVTG